MENENKIKLLKEKLSTESDMTDEKYNQYLVEFCKLIDEGKEINGQKS